MIAPLLVFCSRERHFLKLKNDSIAQDSSIFSVKTEQGEPQLRFGTVGRSGSIAIGKEYGVLSLVH
jgi:hypothetical protein